MCLLIVGVDVVRLVERCVGMANAWSVGHIAEIHRCPGVACVVGVISVMTWMGVVPTMEVYIIMVGAHIMWMVVRTYIRVIGRYCPYKSGYRGIATETQVCRCTVHVTGVLVEEPYAVQVEGHVDFFSGIGIISVYPELVILRIDFLCPYLVDQSIGLNFVLVPAVNHDFLLGIEVVHRTSHLSVGEVAD